MANVFVGEVEIAASVDANRVAELVLEFVVALLDQGGAEDELGVGVWGGDDVGGAGLGSHPGHGETLVEGLRAIVEAMEQVAMNVDHTPIVGVVGVWGIDLSGYRVIPDGDGGEAAGDGEIGVGEGAVEAGIVAQGDPLNEERNGGKADL